MRASSRSSNAPNRRILEILHAIAVVGWHCQACPCQPRWSTGGQLMAGRQAATAAASLFSSCLKKIQNNPVEMRYKAAMAPKGLW